MSTKQHIKFLPMALAISLLFSWNALAQLSTVNGTAITITATDEDLTFAKIKSEINGLNDANNYCSGTICRFNKKLILSGNQALNLGTDNHMLFIGAAKHLEISSTFTSVNNGTVIDGVRSGITTLAHFGNVNIANQIILNNTVETHLRLRITTNSTSTYPRLTVQNSHADSTLEMWVSSAEEGDSSDNGIYLRGGWAGENTVIFEKGAYQASYLNNWFDVTEARESSSLGFKTLPETAYPTNGYKYGGSRAQFGAINADARLDNLIGAIGIGTSAYVYHPAFSNRKIFFRYDFGFDFSGADLTNAKLGFISGSTLFQTETMTGNKFDVDEVVLLKGDTRGGAGGSGGYSQLMFEEFDYKTGNIRIRKNEVIEQDFAYDKVSGVSRFDFSGNFVVDDSWSNTATITIFSNLDQVYDKLKEWLVANLTTDNFMTKNDLSLNLAAYDLVVDKAATNLLTVNTATDVITIKADALTAGTKFTSITTTGTISTANNATLEFGYTHSGGTQKYLELTGLTSADISVMNNQPTTPVSLGNATNQTGTYKLSFAAPTDASDIQIEVTRTGYTTWTQQFPENDLSLMRNVLQYQNVPLADKQIAMLNYALRIMQKEEAINAALNGSTPTVTVTTNTTPATDVATETNQDAILALLKRILVKSAANSEALKEQ